MRKEGRKLPRGQEMRTGQEGTVAGSGLRMGLVKLISARSLMSVWHFQLYMDMSDSASALELL